MYNKDNIATIVAIRIFAIVIAILGANATAIGLALLIHELIGPSPGA